MPSFGTAHQQGLLAFGPEHHSAPSPLPEARSTKRTIEHQSWTPLELDQVLDQVKREGVAFGLQEWEVGTCAVAAPVFGSNGQIAAALA